MNVFEDLVIFELGQRMHAEKDNLSKRGDDLVDVINAIAKSKNMSEQERLILQKGREFLNCVKRPEKLLKKFPNWALGRQVFNEAYEIIKKYELTIF